LQISNRAALEYETFLIRREMAELLDAKKMTETSKSARRHAGKRRLDFSLLVPGPLPGGGTPALYHLPHCGTPTSDEVMTSSNLVGCTTGIPDAGPDCRISDWQESVIERWATFCLVRGDK
jgi:hypothetical protein